ncbi:MAG: SDR family NAD(P)-dependent oxidoreductase [Dehalococcoidia bacterium]
MSDATGRPRSVVVLGGGSEIGLAIARALAERGARAVVLAARRPEALEAPLAALRAAGAVAEAVPFDAEHIATHEAAVGRAFERARALGGDVDVAVVAFGLLDDQRTIDESPERAGRVAVVNYAGAVSSGLAAAQRMRAQGHGTLVVISSMAGQRPRPSNVPYASAKAGLDAFADGLGEALRGTGVRVMTVRPGMVRTRMTAGIARQPLAVSPERVAADVLRGLDRGARVVWTPRAMVLIAAAIRWAPRALFRIVARSR